MLPVRDIVAFALLALLVVPSVAAAPAMQVTSESLHDNSEVPPPDAAAWGRQTLPDNWNISRPGIGGTVWYRFDFLVADPMAKVYAIYLPRVSMNGAVYVNGLLIGSAISPGGDIDLTTDGATAIAEGPG